MVNIYYRGQDLFLYVQFKDEEGKPLRVVNPMFTISYEKNGEQVYLFESEDLMCLDSMNGEYYNNVIIPNKADYSIYHIEYFANLYSDIDKVAMAHETFHVISKSEKYANTVKIYGFIHQSRVGYPLIGASVEITSVDNSKMFFESHTDFEGIWEAFIYPGEYKFTFKKFGFIEEEIIAQIGSEHTELQFDNITLESESDAKRGRGIYNVSDKYVTREGVPLDNLNVKISSVFNINYPIAEDITNSDGEYQVFLDPGLYFAKVEGETVMGEFSQTFRLKVEDNGEFSFENLTNNVGLPVESFVGRGEDNENAKIVEDFVKDANGNPVVDVQLCVYSKNNLNTMVAQDYTDSTGRWIVWLEPGNYQFEFYHPEFHEFTEERTIE